MTENEKWKDAIVRTLFAIYESLDQKQRQLISQTIDDLIGKYSESKTNHRANAQYISERAYNKLLDKKPFKSISQLDKHISKTENGLRHEHIVPKKAIRLALEYKAIKYKTEKTTTIELETISSLLEETHGCAILLAKGEDDQLKEKYTHPSIIEDGEIIHRPIKKFARYFAENTKNCKAIEVYEFGEKTNNLLQAKSRK